MVSDKKLQQTPHGVCSFIGFVEVLIREPNYMLRD